MTNLASTRILGELAGLTPAGVVVAARNVAGEQPPLWPTEIPATRRMSPRRLLEFSAGRAAARDALHHLGLEPAPIPIGAGRAPTWPSGIVGSITHSGPFAAATAARCVRFASLGLDAEDDAGLEPGLLNIVCRPEERARMSVSGAPIEAKVLFSAKEAVYKCLWPLTGTFLEFQEIEILLEPLHGSFNAIGHGPRAAGTAVRQISGRYARADGMVLSLCWLANGDSGTPGSQPRTTGDR